MSKLPKAKKGAKRRKAKKAGYRSGLELEIANQLTQKRVKFGYETTKLTYEVPVRQATYTPDFVLGNGVILEVKGRLTTADRRKMRLVVTSNPNLDIRFVFQRPRNPIYRGSETTYGDWATKNNFKWCGPEIPGEWLN